MTATTVLAIYGSVLSTVALLRGILKERKEKQQRKEEQRAEAAKNFSPSVSIINRLPEELLLRLSAAEEFRVIRMDYVSANGVKAASQEVQSSGVSIDIPIEQQSVGKVSGIANGGGMMKLRVHIEVFGNTKVLEIPADVVQIALNVETRVQYFHSLRA